MLIICSGVFTSSTYADTNNAIDTSSPTPNSGNLNGQNFTPYSGVGRGAFDGQASWVKVYVPSKKDTDVVINQACIDLGNPDSQVTYEMVDLNAREQTTRGPDSGNPLIVPKKTGGSCHNTLKFHIGANVGIESTIKGHENYRVFVLVARMKDGPGSLERYFKISVSNGNSLVGVASPDDFPDLIASKDQYYSVYNDSGTWDYGVMFAPRCSDNSSTGTIKIFDADNGIYQSGMDAKLEKADRDKGGSPNWQTVKNWSPSDVQGGPFGQSGTTGVLKFPVDPQHIYKFTVRNSKNPNTIQIRLPYDQIDGDRSIFGNKGCQDWHLEGDTRMKNGQGDFVHNDQTWKDGDSAAVFRHEVKHTSGEDNASYNWKVEGKYKGRNANYSNNNQGGNQVSTADGGGNLPSGSPNSVKKGDSAPDTNQDNSKYKYKFPANADDGDEYCQRIHYTNKNGGGTGDGYSEPVCVQYKKNGGGACAV